MRFRETKEKISTEETLYTKLVAYSTLIDFDEHELPVLSTFDRVISDIFILSMQYIDNKQAGKESFYTLLGNGGVIYVKDSGHYLLLYNELLPHENIRWVIAKLIYLVKSGKLDDSPDIFFHVEEFSLLTDTFAYQFTCPDIILDECGISDASDIITYCQIPFSFAHRKCQILKRCSTKTFQLAEEVLKKNFKSFIASIKGRG